MIIAAAYVRVSTDEQTEYSPMVQLEDIKAFAEKNGYHIPDEFIFTDEGISGRTAEKRPAFQSMIRQARKKSNHIQYIIVHKYDRFARNKEDAVLYKALLKKDGVKVLSVKEPIPQDDKFAVIYESMLEAMAEYYSLNLAEEVKKTMVKKAEMGEYQGRTPFGYKKENKQLVIIPKQAEIVRYIFEEYAGGKTIYSITRNMNDMGWKTTRNTQFDTRTLTYILHNPVYKGYSRWTPTGRTDRNFNNPDSIIVKGKWEPIVSEELWQTVSDRLNAIVSTAYTHSQYEAKGKHWISGLVKCSACGKSLSICSGYSRSNPYFYFQCSGYMHGRCTVSHSVSSRILIPSVLKALEDISNGGNNYSYTITRRQKDNNNELSSVENLISKFQKRLGNAKAAYLDGIDTLDEYKKNKTSIESEMQHLEQKKRDLLAKQESPFDKAAFSLRLHSILDILNSDHFSKEEKREAARSVIEKIIFIKETRKIKLFLIAD